MTDDGIGRLLVASLHQSIGDVLPQRLDYYEHWLTPMGLKEGRSGLAPLNAVLSFLRQEGEAPYAAVMMAAGRHSAEWHHAESRGGGRWLAVLPRSLRRRLVLRRVRALLGAAYTPMRVSVAVRRGVGTVTLDGSVFCAVRGAWPWPTCTYVVGAVTRQLELHGIEAAVRIVRCRATDAGSCMLEVAFGASAPVTPS
jgi:hypothetical protein